MSKSTVSVYSLGSDISEVTKNLEMAENAFKNSLKLKSLQVGTNYINPKQTPYYCSKNPINPQRTALTLNEPY